MRYPDPGVWRLTVPLKSQPPASVRRAIERKVKQLKGCLRLKFKKDELEIEHTNPDIHRFNADVKEIMRKLASDYLER